MSESTLDPVEHWQRLNALLAEALPLDEPRRERWLETLPDEHRALAPVLRQLLARAQTQTDSFMRAPASAAMPPPLPAGATIEQTGTVVGPYRLLRELGSGGMGTVWLAERIDGSIQRRVAVKLPRNGWAHGVTARLQQERDTLAALEHPNIARLYDAGETASGRPFIAMEYVDGEPIDSYVRRHHLAIDQCLTLFLQVASAVAFAHAHLIVHRDLKPSNILVTRGGDARLLDFGAAKLLRDENLGTLTREIGRALSPEYAAPEQIRDEPITIAADVYSLGIVLYELLTGERPYRLRSESPARLEEAVEAADIPLASTRVGRNRKLARELRGDIDAILAKALRRNPKHRYGSVAAFSADIERYLAGEPVQAQRPSKRYLVRKFVRRHAFGVLASAAIVVALGAGGGLAIWQAQVAKAEAARAARVKNFMASLFTRAVPRAGVGGVVSGPEILTDAANRLQRELAGDPEVAVELGILIGDSFDALGTPEKAAPLLRQTLARANQAFGPRHPLTLKAKYYLANVLKYEDIPAAQALLDDMIPLASADLRANAELVAFALKDRSFIHAKLNEADAAYSTLLQSLQISEKYLGTHHADTINSLGFLSNTYGRFGEREKQLSYATEAMRRAEAAFGKQRPHLELLRIERWYADALKVNDRPGDALPIMRRNLLDQERYDGAVTMRVRDAKLRLADTLLRVGRADEGLAMVHEAVALEKQQNPSVSDDRRAYGFALLSALALANRTTEALQQEAEVARFAQEFGAEPPRARIDRLLTRARMLALSGDDLQAQRVLDEVSRLVANEPREQQFQVLLARAYVAYLANDTASALAAIESLSNNAELAKQRVALQAGVAAQLANVYLERNEFAKAAKQAALCKDLYVRAQIEPSVRVGSCLIASARVALWRGQPLEAERQTLALSQAWARVNANSVSHGEALHWLAVAQAQAGKTEEASRSRAQADEMLRHTTVPMLAKLRS